jgi:hypothetical protein
MPSLCLHQSTPNTKPAIEELPQIAADREVEEAALYDGGADDAFACYMYELDDSFMCIQQSFLMDIYI